MKIHTKCLLLFILPFLHSCDCVNSFEGKVVTKEQIPIEDVKAYYLVSGNVVDSMKTDSTGLFLLSKISGICDLKDNDVVFIKEGYCPLILNEYEEFSKRSSNIDTCFAEMHPGTNITLDNLLKVKLKNKLFDFYNILAIIFNLLTIVYVLKLKVKRKILWVLLIIFINPCIYINIKYFSFTWDILEFILNPHSTNRPWLINISIPFISIVFWIKIKYFNK